jgi:hypothetical protein
MISLWNRRDTKEIKNILLAPLLECWFKVNHIWVSIFPISLWEVYLYVRNLAGNTTHNGFKLLSPSSHSQLSRAVPTSVRYLQYSQRTIICKADHRLSLSYIARHISIIMIIIWIVKYLDLWSILHLHSPNLLITQHNPSQSLASKNRAVSTPGSRIRSTASAARWLLWRLKYTFLNFHRTLERMPGI